MIAVGRFDPENGEPVYIGLHPIFDDKSKVLVVNWQHTYAEPVLQGGPGRPDGSCPQAPVQHRRQPDRDVRGSHLRRRRRPASRRSTPNWRSTTPCCATSTAAVRARCSRSFKRSRQRSTTSSESRWTASWWSREGRAPARRSWHCIECHGSSTTIARTLTPADPCWCSVRADRSSATYGACRPSLGDRDVTQTEVTSLGPDVRRGRDELSGAALAQGRPADGRTIGASRSAACPGS